MDVTHWLRPDAPTSADRLFCHVYGRSGRSSDQFVPGWPYSFVAALESGRTSWPQILAALCLGSADDVAEVTAAQVRRVAEDVIDMGRCQAGDREILIVLDAGYDAPHLAHLLEELPVEILGRMRTGRVTRKLGPVAMDLTATGGRPPKQGKEFRFAKPDTCGGPDAATIRITDRYSTVRTMAWDRIHPRLTTRSARTSPATVAPSIRDPVRVSGSTHGVRVDREPILLRLRVSVDRLPPPHPPVAGRGGHPWCAPRATALQCVRMPCRRRSIRAGARPGCCSVSAMTLMPPRAMRTSCASTCDRVTF